MRWVRTYYTGKTCVYYYIWTRGPGDSISLVERSNIWSGRPYAGTLLYLYAHRLLEWLDGPRGTWSISICTATGSWPLHIEWSLLPVLIPETHYIGSSTVQGITCTQRTLFNYGMREHFGPPCIVKFIFYFDADQVCLSRYPLETRHCFFIAFP